MFLAILGINIKFQGGKVFGCCWKPSRAMNEGWLRRVEGPQNDWIFFSRARKTGVDFFGG